MKPQYETRFGGLHVIMLLLAYFFSEKGRSLAVRLVAAVYDLEFFLYNI